MHILKNIYKCYITLENVEKEQIQFRKDLGRIKQSDPRDKSPEEEKTINNIKNLYNLREITVQLFNDYTKNMSRDIYDSKQRTRTKILTPKRMLQRLPIALAHIKAGNNSEGLLNEIMQIIYSLYHSKEITKKNI